jgi:hypothetical protein
MRGKGGVSLVKPPTKYPDDFYNMLAHSYDKSKD